MTADIDGHVADLERRFGRPPFVRFRCSPLGGTVAELAASGGRATVSLYGGQVLSWTPARRDDVLWLSPLARLGTGKAVRGGIPVCWPWFGPHGEDAKLPAHGLVRTATWSVIETSAEAGRASLVLACPRPAANHGSWPEGAEVALAVVLGETLSIALVTRNTSRRAFRIGEALHTYLAVGDITEVSIGGLVGCDYVDQLAAGSVRQDGDAVRFSGEVDRIYRDPGPATTVDDRQRRRRSVLTKSGSRSTVVWNPWQAKSDRLGDMGPDGYRRMVCVETANAGADVVEVAPGDTHRLAVEIAVVDL